MARFDLSQDAIPSAWFNVLPVMPEPLQPPLHPGTREPIGPDDLAPLFPMGLIAQEVSAEPWIDVPGEVLDILKLWRPTPLVRAERLERALGTPARIYFKDESVSPAGSHKTNTSVPQAFYNAAEGTTRLATETGAGQWGSALSFACSQFDLECKVYMVRASYEQKPYRRVLMETWGASVVPSPVDDVDSPGSLGLAISDAVADAASRDDTHYSLGSVLNHVLLHQTVIGLEAKEQLQLAGEDAARRRDRQLRRRVEPRRHRVAVRARHRRAPRRGRAVVVPHADRGLVRLRLRRHRGHDAAAADVHARPRLRAAVDPRRRAALPRRLADHLQPGAGAGAWRPSPTRRARPSRPRCSSPGPRARSPRPRPATRSGR